MCFVKLANVFLDLLFTKSNYVYLHAFSEVEVALLANIVMFFLGKKYTQIIHLK